PIVFLALYGLACMLLMRNRITPALFGGLTVGVILIDLMMHNPSLMPMTSRQFFD
ncbi:MAG: hypothetical protein GWM98_16835, partial [Nitrospinaceae bacterium]|nr:hypothetical protein [Nitrospinaceae bacterium]